MNLNPTASRVLFVTTITGIVCAIYILVLGQFLEVPIKKITRKQDTEQIPLQVESPFLPYFQKDAWECTPNAAHLVNSQNIVMFFRNITMDGNKAKSDECTLLIAPGEKTFPMTKNREKTFYPIKVNIYEGAEIQFDSNDGKITPTPLGGKLNGPVQISYKVRIKGFLIDCLVRTSDLLCDMKSVQTSRPVEFFLGPFSAKGTQFKLLFQDAPNQEKLFSGISSIELGKLEHITFRLNPMLLKQLDLKMTPEMEKRIQAMFGQKMEIPITLKCNGSVFYDVKEGVVKFSQNVQLSCNYPNAPHDTLTCDDLEFHLASDLEERFLRENSSETETNEASLEKLASENLETSNSNSQVLQEVTESPETSISAENESQLGNLPLNSIQAKQNVVLTIPTFNASAKAENLEFHPKNQELLLSGNQQAEISFDQHEFHAFNISYTFPPKNVRGLGEIHCDQKGGWLKTTFSAQSRTSTPNTPQSANLPDDSSDVTVRWKESLRGFPQENGRYDLYVTGGVEIESPKFGSLNADSISVRLRTRTSEDEKNDVNLALELGIPVPKVNSTGNLNSNSDPGTGKKSNLLPEYVTASGNVHLEVDQPTVSLDARLTKIRFMFQKPPHVPDVLLQVQKTRVQEKATSKQNYFPQNLAHESESETRKRNFVLTAGELQGLVQLLPGKEGFFVPQISLTGPAGQDLYLREEAPLQTSERLISLRARKILLHDLLPETLQGEIVGSNTVLSGLGFRLESTKIAVNCASNRIDINSPGKMSVFTRQKAGTDLNYSTLIETVITWKKALTFNGLELTALEDVSVKLPRTTLQMDCVQALLTEKIQLNKPPKMPNEQEALESIQTIAAKHNIKLVHQNFDQNNHLSCICTLQTDFLNYFPGNKKISMNGQGTFYVSYPGNTKSPFQSPKEENISSVPDSTPEKKWNQVRMDYNGGISGNLQDGEFIIKDKISALMQPVPRPDYAIPETHLSQQMLPEDAFRFTCDQVTLNLLSLDEILNQSPSLKELKLEVKAENNVKFETSVISADGVMLKYSQEKNMCQILGDERTKVNISQQEFLGGKRNEMTTDVVEINLKDMHLTLKDVTMQSSY